jgi:tetratricopeptide (TPR) repeat protein
MSWSAPSCPHCHSPSRFDAPVPDGPDFTCGLAWRCDACGLELIELIPHGPAHPRPGYCLNCDHPLDERGVCPDCEVDHQQIVERVRAHCGLPPQIEKIEDLRDLGLFRVALNAVHLRLRLRLRLRLQEDPNDVEALALCGRLLHGMHRPAAGIPFFRRAVALGADLDVQIHLGAALADSGKPREAIEIYEQILTGQPTLEQRTMLLTNLGGCHSALGDPRGGEVYHRRAIATDPEDLGSRWNLFANLHGQGRNGEALEVIDQAMLLSTLEPDEIENMQAYRAELLIRLGRLDDALAAADASLVGDPEQPDRLFLRGRILLGLGRHEQARRALLRVLAHVPGSRAARELLAQVTFVGGVVSQPN